MSNLSKQKKALTSYEGLKRLNGAEAEVRWKIGEYLFDLKSDSRYKLVFGSEHENDKKNTWKSFLAQCEPPMALGTADYWVTLYQKWVAMLKYKPKELIAIHTRKLSIAVPYATDKNAEDILSNAKALSFSDFKAYLTGKEERCDHKEKDSIVKCRLCHKTLK